MTGEDAAVQRAVKDFERDGFCVFRGFFSADERAEICARLDGYVENILPSLPAEAAMYEEKSDPRSMFRLESMHLHDPFFRALMGDDRLIALAGRLLGDQTKPQDVQMFAKAPRIGQPTPPHQDGYYFKLEPNNALTLWIPIDRADEENGCVRYVAGSHKLALRPHARSGTFGFSLGVADFGDDDRAREVSVTVDPGDMAAHHCGTIHRTDANRSDRLRRAIGLVYYAAAARQNKAAFNTRRADAHKRWEGEGRI